MLEEQFDQMALIMVDECEVIGDNMCARFFGTQCRGMELP